MMLFLISLSIKGLNNPPRLIAPLPAKVGTTDPVEALEIGDDRVTIYRQGKEYRGWLFVL